LSVIVIDSSVGLGCAEPTVTLSTRKDSGYALFDDLYGKFTITAKTSNDATYVEFYLDGELQFTSTKPYTWSFDTANYPIGNHNIRVIVFNSDGESISTSMQTNFISFPTTFVMGLIVIVALSFALLLFLRTCIQ
jgi:hypothetical protein